MKHIFLLEDDETMGRGIAMALTGTDTSVTCRSTLTQARETLAEDARKNQQEKSGVTISTLHSVKGLEYDCVYILDVNEGVIPYRKAVLEEEIEEERRMFYVGMTRARKQLTLCTVRERFDKKEEPSRFLDELLQST